MNLHAKMHLDTFIYTKNILILNVGVFLNTDKLKNVWLFKKAECILFAKLEGVH